MTTPLRLPLTRQHLARPGALTRYGLGAAAAGLTLGAVDALPGPNLSYRGNFLSLNYTDMFVVILMLVLVVANVRRGFRELLKPGPTRTLTALCAALFLWWLITVARTPAEVPLEQNVYTGRDFAYLALLLPLFSGAFADRSTRSAFVAVVAVWMVPVCAAEVLWALGGPQIPVVAHPYSVTEESGLNRLYSFAADLAVPVLPLAIGSMLFVKNRRVKIAAGIAGVTALAQIVVALGRVKYAGEILGLSVTSALWFGVMGSGRRATRALCAIIAIAALVVALNPSKQLTSSVSAVGDRISDGIEQTTGSSQKTQSDSLVYRQIEKDAIEYHLKGRWIEGIGFLDPRSYYLPGTIRGSVRNSDLGWFNAAATMGIVGLILVYAVGFIALAYFVRARFTPPSWRLPDLWLGYGATAYLVYALGTSNTLGAFTSASGCTVTAAVVGAGVAALYDGDAGRRSEFDSTEGSTIA